MLSHAATGQLQLMKLFLEYFSLKSRKEFSWKSGHDARYFVSTDVAVFRPYFDVNPAGVQRLFAPSHVTSVPPDVTLPPPRLHPQQITHQVQVN